MTRPFSPDEALSARIEIVPNALLVPYNDPTPRRGKVHLGGVYRSDLSFVENSLCFISETRQVNRPQPGIRGDDAAELAGTWLFGGKHDRRFGHFLVETLSRLWALEYCQGPIAGIAFLPPKIVPAKRASLQLQSSAPLFDLVGELPPRRAFTEKTRFERLIVPPQGCGAGMMAPGSPEFRAFINRRFAPGIQPKGAKKLYVSRTKMTGTPGHLLFERLIEDAAREEGYDIFHPQEHGLAEQIASYRAADYILGVEGSAFHMIAFSARPSANIAMIRRRMSDAADGFIDQIARITGANCVDVNCLTENFFIPDTLPMANGTPDLGAIYALLQREVFFAKHHSSPDLTPEVIEAEKAALAAAMTKE
ncbi:glycosyltransferase family 61 protein [Xinfangfangia sp. D13-10-4-6]|uniref:glycosyltransferase family 61 protein n=1 Tax=Pseudogemmobacter hezensis TaxID=2737662 RepID=UPI001555BED3|nr:glycosyltransferase family 61 protein [Pseudogemmobacter hezensis]NPD14231.1 glycosyltransferase family 61 protein [Pseudogemmobacter hezensis]